MRQALHRRNGTHLVSALLAWRRGKVLGSRLPDCFFAHLWPIDLLDLLVVTSDLDTSVMAYVPG